MVRAVSSCSTNSSFMAGHGRHRLPLSLKPSDLHSADPPSLSCCPVLPCPPLRFGFGGFFFILTIGIALLSALLAAMISVFSRQLGGIVGHHK